MNERSKNFLIIAAIASMVIFAVCMFSAMHIANKVAQSVGSEPNKPAAVEEVAQEPVSSTVEAARSHLDEQLKIAESMASKIHPTGSYLENGRRAFEYAANRVRLPLPYEPGSNKITEGQSLSEDQKNEIYEVQRQRTETLHTAIDEYKRRAVNPEPPQAEDAAELQKLALRLNMNVPPIVIGDTCGGTETLGCYFFSGEIEITPKAVSMWKGKNECAMLELIAHETRHWQQELNNGVGDYSIEELEKDAQEFMRDNPADGCK